VGDVRDPEGRPLQGVTISIARMIGPVGRAESRRFLYPYASTVRGTPLEDVLIATSDERGRFRFPAVPSPGMLTLNADAPGKGSIRENVYPRPGSDDRPTVVGPMHPEARLEGRVVSTVPGVDLGNRPVRIFATGGIAESLTTDHQGRFKLAGLPKGMASIYLGAPCARPDDPWTSEQANLELVPGTTARPIIRIVKGGCVEGRVVDEASGAPLAGVLLSIRQVVAEAAATEDSVVISNADGRYAARLAPGTWNVYRSDGKPAFKNPIEVVEGETITLDPLRARP
jgi:hypothetical protein